MSIFPKDFVWGVSTDAYQIEGGGQANGRGVSTWDAIRKEPGRILDGSDPNTNIKGYENWKEDIQLIKNLNVTHYRLSLNWSRILPYGDINCINEEGVKYYRALLEELVANNIEPIVTLYHFDMPLRLYRNDSWLNESSISWYEDFCRLCFEKYGDLVKLWLTSNDMPMRAWNELSKLDGEAFFGVTGVFEENVKRIPFKAAHHMLLAHAKVYRMYKKEFFDKQNGKIGVGLGGDWFYPKTSDDVETARRAETFSFDWLVQPIFGKDGDYPLEMRECLGKNSWDYLPEFTEEQKEELKGSADFLGFNFYRPTLVESGVGESTKEKIVQFKYSEDDYEKLCGNDFWVRYKPEGLEDLLNYIKDHYNNIPTLITENGVADLFDESADPLQDDHRIRYIDGHINAVKRAIENSCNVMGFIVWSLMDNFEWNDGFAVKFGLYSVDMADENRKRTAKKSVEYYKNLIQENRH
ncbi:unnamed protein product [Auanema sp. JU1783]|nr:unnamed protein product [Auanema sp. JU1783]